MLSLLLSLTLLSGQCRNDFTVPLPSIIGDYLLPTLVCTKCFSINEARIALYHLFSQAKNPVLVWLISPPTPAPLGRSRRRDPLPGFAHFRRVVAPQFSDVGLFSRLGVPWPSVPTSQSPFQYISGFLFLALPI